MKVIKYETNFKRRKFFKEYTNISIKKDSKNEENKVINIYPTISFQDILGFGRSPYRSYLL